MTTEKLDLSATGSFSPIFLDYLAGKAQLQPFYERTPTLASFREQINAKDFSKQQRASLTAVLQEQYQHLSMAGPVRRNLDSLNEENTYTVTTGHQLNIFTGPLYFIYKIVTVINLCKKLKEAYPACHFVPVYWMASEDHDFEEINHFSLFGKTYTWQTDQRGAVGRFKTDSISKVLEALPTPLPLFEEAYRSCSNLAAATRCYVNDLFGEEGLLIVDADHPSLKASFRQVMVDDIIKHTAHKLVADASATLDDMGYKTQIHPRDINFFYLKDQLRERIIQDGDRYQVLNTNISFSEGNLLSEIEEHPERFSPNVVLRPLYQEMILPNLAYVGGPAEVSYWLQLKTMFAHYQVPFPILLPRNFAMIVDQTSHRKLSKVQVPVGLLFMDKQSLVSHFVEEHADHELVLQEEKAALESVYEQIRQKAVAIDKSLEGFLGAELTKALKSLEGIEKKMKKAEEKNQQVAIDQLISLKEKLFPGGNLQERHENFLNFYINNPDFISEVLHRLDPLDFRFHILGEAEA